MESRTEYFIAVVLVFVVSLVVIASHYLIRTHKAKSASWSLLVGRLMELDRDCIATIASDAEFTIEPSRISAMIGGMKGLENLQANCDVLIDLACYVQRWYPEALVVAEELRLNAREIKWHVGRLRETTSAQNLQAHFPDYAQKAVSIYYEMTRNLLELYQRTNCPGLIELQRAI